MNNTFKSVILILADFYVCWLDNIGLVLNTYAIGETWTLSLWQFPYRGCCLILESRRTGICSSPKKSNGSQYSCQTQLGLDREFCATLACLRLLDQVDFDTFSRSRQVALCCYENLRRTYKFSGSVFIKLTKSSRINTSTIVTCLYRWNSELIISHAMQY